MAEIVNVSYTASDGTVIPFQMDKLTRIKTANFHNWSYEPQILERRYGGRVIRFGKSAASYYTTLYFGGSTEGRKTRIDDFHTAIERDIRSTSAGRLTWGDWYIECFIRSSSTYPDEWNDYTVNEVEIYAPYPFWLNEQTQSFAVQEFDPESYEWLDYDYGFDYDYSPDPVGEGQVVIDAPGSSEFRLVFYGPVNMPTVTIAGIRRSVDVGLDEGEYLTIDSRKKTVIITRANGDTVNAFNYRSKEASIFTPIPSGTSSIVWSGKFGFDLTVYKERSEPAWT